MPSAPQRSVWPRPTVLVVVPARDESAHVGACLTALRRAAHYAVATGAAELVRIVLVANRCRDDTAAQAVRLLGEDGVCVEDLTSQTVGATRRFGVQAGLGMLGRTADSDVWIFSTDADSEVPVDWITHGLTVAGASGAALVLGVTDLAGALLPPGSDERYAALVRRQRRGPDDHDHVYGANLAIRADAYLAAGGFADVAVSEDVALAAACRDLGIVVATPTGLSVSTSARIRGRAPGGLADVLLALAGGPAS